MNTTQALQVLINAVKAANKAGAYYLQDSKVIAEAVETFTAKPKEPVETLKKDVPKKK